MPTFRHTEAFTANGTSTPLQDEAWQYRVLPWPALIQLATDCTDANGVQQLTVGSDVQLQESPIPGGGTAGTFPSELAEFSEYYGDAGDEIIWKGRETAGGTPSYNLVIHVTPR